MKYPLTHHICMVCNWRDTNHKCFDGLPCPSCGGPLMSETITQKKDND